MSFMNKLTQLAKSDKGKELIDKAQAIANDPKTREKIDAAKGKVEEQIEAAKGKLAEKRAEKGDEAAAETPVAEAPAATPPATPPAYGDDDAPKAA